METNNNAANAPTAKAPPEILNILRKKYLPASEETATLHMTTAAIAEEIAFHTGKEVTVNELYDWLWKEGYRYEVMGEMRMEWMFTEAVG